MPPATPSGSKEVVTAALLVVGGKILSGRTKDQNIGYVAEYLTAVGIDLKEVRVVGDEEGAIVDALNALRHRYSYVFTTGGIGPTHGDIIADCVAKAFGVTIDTDPRALAILHEWVETTGAEMNEARAEFSHAETMVADRRACRLLASNGGGFFEIQVLRAGQPFSISFLN